MSVNFKQKLILTVLLGSLSFTACSSLSPVEEVETIAPSVQRSTNDLTTITVNVTGFKQQTGMIMAALTDEAVYSGGEPLRGIGAKVAGERVSFTFENIPTGTYAIRMFHDVDSNGTMNTNAFGIPNEPFAFSNNAKGLMGPAPWEKSKFDVPVDGAVQNISF